MKVKIRIKQCQTGEFSVFFECDKVLDCLERLQYVQSDMFCADNSTHF